MVQNNGSYNGVAPIAFLNISEIFIHFVQVLKALSEKVDITIRDEDGNSAVEKMFEDEDLDDDVENIVKDAVKCLIKGSENFKIVTIRSLIFF